MTELESIEDFLKQRRIAIAGVSITAADFSRVVYNEFRSRGYQTIPINPNASEIDSERCYARVQDIDPAPDGVLLFTRPEVSEQVVKDCVAAGVRRVWFHRSIGAGSVSDKAVAMARDAGMQVVAGQCPMMFLPKAQWFHRFHALIKRITRAYPS